MPFIMSKNEFKERLQDEVAKAPKNLSKAEWMEFVCNKAFEIWKEDLEAGRIG